MTTSMYEYVLEQLAKTELTYAQIAEATGLSKRTIEKISRREIKNPGVSHIQLLNDHFRKLSEGSQQERAA